MACSLPSGESINEEYLSCTICRELYNEDLNTPRNLPCGHTLCSLCIDKVLTSQYKHCPECRKVITVKCSGQLPICYIALRIARNITNRAENMIQQQETDTGISISNSSSNLDDCERSLSSLSFAQPLKNISLSLENIFGAHDNNYYTKLNKRTDLTLCQIASKVKELQAELSDNDMSIKLFSENLMKEKNRILKMQSHLCFLNDSENRLTSLYNSSDIDELLEEVMDVKESAENNLADDDSMCYIEKVIGEKIIKKRFEKCRQLHVVHEVEAIKRYARVAVYGENVMLHCLRALPQPSLSASIVQFESIANRIPVLATVWLSLFWDNAVQGEVRFSVNNCCHGLHFVRMCTGENNACFLNKMLFQTTSNNPILRSHADVEHPCLVPESRRTAGCDHIVPRVTACQLVGHRVTKDHPADTQSFGTFFVHMAASNTGHYHPFGTCVYGYDVLAAMVSSGAVLRCIVKDCGVFVESF